MRRGAGVLALVALLLAAAPARAEIWVLLENPNGPELRDGIELFDVVCGLPLPAVSLRGRDSVGLAICGGLGTPGRLRLRVAGEQAWTEIGGLHGWSVVETPRRPMTLGRRSPARAED